MDTPDRFLLDTAFILALLNRRDSLHGQAKALIPRFHSAQEVWVTEAVLTEVANSLSNSDRRAAVAFIEQCRRAPNISVLPVNGSLFEEGLQMYRRYDDKAWSLTDCVSFVVMRQRGLTEALTCDHHFNQAGFHPLLSPS